MEWIGIGIMIDIGFYLAPMVIGLVMVMVVGFLNLLFGK
jgi:ABC-type sulfate transport system permease subunit